MALQEENDPSSSSSSFSPPPPPPPVLCLRFQGWHRPSDGDVPGRKDPHRALVPQSSLSGKVPSPREMALALLIAAQILVGICSAKRRDPVERIPPIPQEASTDPSLYMRFVPMEIRSTLARNHAQKTEYLRLEFQPKGLSGTECSSRCWGAQHVCGVWGCGVVWLCFVSSTKGERIFVITVDKLHAS